MKVFKRYRKSYMTLLETMIAMSILSVLLVVVFGFFRQLNVLSQLSDKSQQESFQLRYVETRLAYIFERIVNENETKTRNFYFYTQPPLSGVSDLTSLVLTFNNGVRQDPNFSGDVLARLYVNEDKQLALAMWPLHLKDPHKFMQQEILMNYVVDMQLEFYSAPERIANDKDIVTKIAQPKAIEGLPVEKDKETEPEKDKWYEGEWALTHRQMPSIIKIKLKVVTNPESLKRVNTGTVQKTEAIEYSFVLPSSKNPVHFPKG